MKRLFFLFSVFYFMLLNNLSAQQVTFPDDAINRGFVNRPYMRYEAEADKCITDGTILSPTFDQRTLQSEASNQSAVNLINKGSYIQWTNSASADGLTLRFSLPDNSAGTGTQGTFDLYVNDTFVQSITVNSYWAWQYFLYYGSKYPDNIPSTSTKFPRMRFDETHVKLSEKIPANAIFRLVKADDNTVPYTIDFVELEDVPAPVTFESIPDSNKVIYTPDLGPIYSFIANNRGKTIYIPAGRYETDRRIILTSGDNTKILGAGMWYTEIYFNASSDYKSTYNYRGIEAYGNNIVVQDLYLNTVNNKRYYDNNSIYQVGKGLQGSFGTNSIIKNVWIEHFECGGWIEGAVNLLITNSRFRNNYADGMNLANACINCTVDNCSFRNNGDDDMASWSRATGLCENNTFRYCTSENNWRASAMGFFGGKQNKAYNCVVFDPMEAGLRVTSDFPGMPFSSDGFMEFHDISVYKGGVANGTMGISGDLWGNQQGAIQINSTTQYDVQNIKFYNIDLYNSKYNAVFIGSTNTYIRNLILNNININGTGNYGLYFSSAKGNGTYCNINYNSISSSTNYNSIPSTFTFTEDCSSAVKSISANQFKAFNSKGKLHISGLENLSVSVFNQLGGKVFHTLFAYKDVEVPINPGFYIVRWNELNQCQKVLIH